MSRLHAVLSCRLNMHFRFRVSILTWAKVSFSNTVIFFPCHSWVSIFYFTFAFLFSSLFKILFQPFSLSLPLFLQFLTSWEGNPLGGRGGGRSWTEGGSRLSNGHCPVQAGAFTFPFRCWNAARPKAILVAKQQLKLSLRFLPKAVHKCKDVHEIPST